MEGLDQMLRIGWLIDGTGGAVQHDMIMRIKAGRIVSVAPRQPDQPVTIDLFRATVLPPFMDAHVHLVFSGTMDPERRKAQLGQGAAEARSTMVKHLKDCWRHGVVAVRDGGDSNGEVLRVKKEVPPLPEAPVHVAATCWAWHAPGRYGKMIGRAPAQGRSPAAVIREHLAGIDHLKVIQSGLNSIDRYGHQGSPQFSEEDLSRMAAAAREVHLPVMIHANGETAVGTAIAAGCNSIEHGYFMGEDHLRRMADRDIAWVPTVIPMAALAQAPGLTSAQRDVARRTVDHQLAQIGRAQAAGVTIALGTDAGSQGVDHGAAVIRELELLVQAGLSLPAAVRCATLNVARLMGFQDRGALVAGRRADFLVIEGEPEKMSANLSKNGRICMGGHFIR